MTRRREGFDFPKGEGNEIHSIIYVPSTKNTTEPISQKEFKKRINDTIRFYRKYLGGSTKIIGVGNWRSGSKESVTEKIAKIENFSSSVDYDKADLKIKKWLYNKKREWGQNAISYEFEESLYFV